MASSEQKVSSGGSLYCRQPVKVCKLRKGASWVVLGLYSCGVEILVVRSCYNNVNILSKDMRNPRRCVISPIIIFRPSMFISGVSQFSGHFWKMLLPSIQCSCRASILFPTRKNFLLCIFHQVHDSLANLIVCLEMSVGLSFIYNVALLQLHCLFLEDVLPHFFACLHRVRCSVFHTSSFSKELCSVPCTGSRDVLMFSHPTPSRGWHSTGKARENHGEDRTWWGMRSGQAQA